ncbi:MAG: YcxB family protein [Verrucomicrobiae bacterium]|nr:YcxB family protein [Verrucomicrobiae bacterium]
MPTASIKFTSDYLIAAFQRYRRQHRGRYVGLAIKLLALALLAPLAFWMFWQEHLVIGGLFAALSVFMFFAHHVDYWLARRSFTKSPYRDEDVLIEFTDAGFHARSPKQDTKLQWSAFTKVAHFRDGFLLFQGPKFFNWIPFSSLGSPSQAAELSAFLRSKISEHKIVEPSAAPNGGPATQLGNSGVTEGPPWVS